MLLSNAHYILAFITLAASLVGVCKQIKVRHAHLIGKR